MPITFPSGHHLNREPNLPVKPAASNQQVFLRLHSNEALLHIYKSTVIFSYEYSVLSKTLIFEYCAKDR
jgi:hypothetical protein